MSEFFQVENKEGFEVTPERKEELYMYSLRKMAENNMDTNRGFMTGLYNLRAFHFKADDELRYNRDINYSLIVLDLSNFKAINEFCGRAGGDALLKHIADILRGYAREHVVLAHFRADIFGMLFPFDDRDEIVKTILEISSKIDTFELNFKVLPAFGICVCDDHDLPSTIYRDYATMALNTIKGKFFAKYAFYDEGIRKKMLAEKYIENEIVDALTGNQIKAYIQPKIDMITKEIIGGEALVRWVHPEKGVIPPGEFIPVIEKNGLIIDVDIAVWRQVFDFQSKRKKAGRKVVPISINISRIHAYDNTFKDYLVALSNEYEVEPALVPLEITESSFIDTADEMYESMHYLKAKGFKLSMDDFGTGYSTMTMLKDQPVDEIKIDKGFIDDLDNANEQIIVNSMVSMLKAMGKSVIVEGVEDEKQQDFLVQSGCTSAQGFLYHKPMPMEEFESKLDA